MNIVFLALWAILYTPTEPSPTFKKLYALQGSWSMLNKKGSYTCEYWKKTSATSLSGKSFFVNAKDTTAFETVQLEEKPTGIFYTITATNEDATKAVTFKLTNNNGNKFVFENPTHNFPKMIVYDFIGKDSIHAYMGDGKEGSSKTAHFYYKKQKS
jgi:hypothetical protein